jgi:phosphoglycerate dehydrogenase-like enzyme
MSRWTASLASGSTSCCPPGRLAETGTRPARWKESAVTALALCLDKVGDNVTPEQSVLAPLGITATWPAKTPEAVERQLKKADALLVNVTAVDAKLLDRSPQCRVVVTYGVGYDHIDLDEARRRRVVVANVPDFCTDEVADHTMALLLALARQIMPGHELVRAGGWGVQALGTVRRIRGRTLGLVGLGRTGRTVATRAKSPGLQVIAYDPQVTWGGETATMVTSLRELLREADFVSMHAPLQRETARLINDRALALMKPGSILINTSRGGLVDTNALLRALDHGPLAAAGLDVFEEEPLRRTSSTGRTCSCHRTRPTTPKRRSSSSSDPQPRRSR